MVRICCLAVSFVLGFVLPSVSGADEPFWPGWLGPDRSGWVNNYEPPAEWPKDLKLAWRVNVGTGYGSPLVVGSQVYQHARQGDEEVVLCLDLESGVQKWKRSYTTTFKIGGGGERHGKGPKSCPIYADGRIFTLGISGVLSAWRANDGELLWRKDEQRFGANHPYWGASTSPIVDENRLIVHLGNDKEGALFALDVSTGKEYWKQGADGTAYSSPRVEQIDGVRQVIEWNHRALVGVESETGRKLWEQPFPHEGHNQNMPTPAFYKGRVLLGAENRGLQSYRPSRHGTVWTVTADWSQNEVALDMSSAVINGSHLYGFSHYDSGRLFCLDVESGKVRWKGPGRTGQNVTFPTYFA